MIKIIAINIVLYSIIISILSYFYFTTPFALGVLIGGLFMLANLAGLSFVWRLIFSKKSIALAIMVIIFKYVVLGMILWSFATFKWLNTLGFVVGLASLLFAILIATIIKSFSKTELN